MKKAMALAAILFVSFTAVVAQDPDVVKGVWLNDNKDARVEIYKHGDKYYGKIVWTRNMYEADGKTLKKDSKNANEQLRNRTIQNMVILSGLSYSDGEWTGGEIYDPTSGKTYKSKMRIKGNSLEVRGYVGSPMFGKTTVWTRIS